MGYLDQMYYSGHFVEIKVIINQFNSFDALPFHDAKKVFENPSIQHGLNLIYARFSKIPELITSLEARYLTPVLNHQVPIRPLLKIIGKLPLKITSNTPLVLHNSLKVMKESSTTASELPDVFAEKIKTENT
ncbi:Hypothetical protein CINCED_3A017530 [Cinara cedri]|uniref:Uncharacterized protein n=1 Tax=Cinara cedri TaxID=506608 RepID=A0A5E4N2A2_9HEMI|nr:Hypothetical protein CINCED_3A017530 [Cinara cedri]